MCAVLIILIYCNLFLTSGGRRSQGGRRDQMHNRIPGLQRPTDLNVEPDSSKTYAADAGCPLLLFHFIKSMEEQGGLL